MQAGTVDLSLHTKSNYGMIASLHGSAMGHRTLDANASRERASAEPDAWS